MKYHIIAPKIDVGNINVAGKQIPIINQNKMKTVLEINLDHQKLIFIARVKKNVFESSIFAGSTKEDIQAMNDLYQVLKEV